MIDPVKAPVAGRPWTPHGPSRKAEPVSAAVKALTTKQVRERWYLKLFQAADPGQELTIPAMLEAAAERRAREAHDAAERGREVDAGRALNDVACCRAIAQFVGDAEDEAIRSKLRSIDRSIVARLIELADERSGNSTRVEEVAGVLAGIRGDILEAIDCLRDRAAKCVS
jgi:hypothetical protein